MNDFKLIQDLEEYAEATGLAEINIHVSRVSSCTGDTRWRQWLIHGSFRLRRGCPIIEWGGMKQNELDLNKAMIHFALVIGEKIGADSHSV